MINSLILEASQGYSFNYIMLIVWAVVIVLGIIIEACTIELASIWFCIAGVVCLGLNFIPGIPYWVEIIVFFVLSIILLIALRPLANKMLVRKKSNTNVDSLIGKETKLLKAINGEDYGEVKLSGLVYTAVSADNSVIEEGKIVKVVSITGNKLYVKKVD